MNKNLIMDENPDTYTQNPSWYKFDRVEIENTINAWKTMETKKDDFRENKKKLSFAIETLKNEFNSSCGYWVKNRNRPGQKHRNLTLEYIMIYVKAGVQWKKYQVESKINLWWFQKYPTRLERYVENMF